MRPRYEVFPLAGIEDEVAEHVPPDVTITVTSSPRRGIETTLSLAEELAKRGFAVVPHISARLVVDEAHLKEVVDRLREAGIRDAFVVAGDVETPAGVFDSAAALLSAAAKLGHGLDEIGIAGYPESHPFISDEQTIRAMYDKAPFATYVVSQLCFDTSVIAAWAVRVAARGLGLPIYVGIAGDVSNAKLFRISRRIGVGESARFLRKHGNLLARMVVPGGYSPDRLLAGMERHVRDPWKRIVGFHVYTFNEVEKTERWRRAALERLHASAASAGDARPS